MKLFADYISSLFIIYSATIFLEKTSPPLPAGVLIDMTVVTQSSYFHMCTEVQKNLFNVFRPDAISERTISYYVY